MKKKELVVELKNIKLDLEEEEGILPLRAAKKLNLDPSELRVVRILRRSIDARKKDRIQFVYNVELE